MIDWLTVAELDARLSQIPPIGLGLRGFFHGRMSASLVALLEHEPEASTVEGVGDVQMWAGLVDGTPFSLTGQRRGEVTVFGIALPIALKDGRMDVGLLHAVGMLAPAFRATRGPHIEGLPYVGGGFGVVPRGSNEPVFRSSVREDAVAVAAFLDDPDRYEIAILPVAPAQWIVAGPRVGATMSRLEVVPTKEAADELAKAWSAELGEHFSVFEGQLPA